MSSTEPGALFDQITTAWILAFNMITLCYVVRYFDRLWWRIPRSCQPVSRSLWGVFNLTIQVAGMQRTHFHLRPEAWSGVTIESRRKVKAPVV
jgi:hypothetical protein